MSLTESATRIHAAVAKRRLIEDLKKLAELQEFKWQERLILRAVRRIESE